MKTELLDDILNKAYVSSLGKIPKAEIIDYALVQMRRYSPEFPQLVDDKINAFSKIPEQRCHITKVKKNFLIEVRDLFKQEKN